MIIGIGIFTVISLSLILYSFFTAPFMDDDGNYSDENSDKNINN